MEKPVKTRQWAVLGRTRHGDEFLFYRPHRNAFHLTREDARAEAEYAKKNEYRWLYATPNKYFVRPVTIGDKVCKWKYLGNDGGAAPCEYYRAGCGREKIGRSNKFCGDCGGRVKVVK